MSDLQIDRRPTGLKEARELVRDLFPPRAALYWSDFLGSASVGWASLLALVVLPPGGLTWLLAPLAILALYRALLFIHELTHLSEGALPHFRFAWNLLVGVPMLVPSILYEGVHTDHHRRTVYGTPDDPEYLPLARGSRGQVVWFVVQVLFAPALFALRFLVAGPIGLLVPGLHRWLERRASSLVVNPRYVRRELTPAARRHLILAEVAALCGFGILVALALTGIVPWRFFLVWYGVSAGVALINQVRTLVAHRFRNDGSELDVIGQLLDTVNVPGGPMTSLWAPVGLRFHALHHYLPDLPYHSLGEAHRRLLSSLPEDSAYREVNERSLWSALRSLWRDTAPSRTK